MRSQIFQKNSLYTALLALLICVSFFSFYTTSIFNNNLNVTKQVTSKNQSIFFNHIITRNNGNEKIKKDNTAIDQIDIDSEESFFDKISINSQKNTFTSKILYSFSNLFIIMSLCIFFLYFRGWLIQVFQSRYKLFLVHYILLKDGKKDALSYLYIV